jgi:hypothetical protein
MIGCNEAALHVNDRSLRSPSTFSCELGRESPCCDLRREAQCVRKPKGLLNESVASCLFIFGMVAPHVRMFEPNNDWRGSTTEAREPLRITTASRRHWRWKVAKRYGNYKAKLPQFPPELQTLAAK